MLLVNLSHQVLAILFMEVYIALPSLMELVLQHMFRLTIYVLVKLDISGVFLLQSANAINFKITILREMFALLVALWMPLKLLIAMPAPGLSL